MPFRTQMSSVARRFSRRAVAVVIATVTFVAARPLPAAADWKDSLRTTLEAAYPLTKRSALSSDRLTKQGVVLVVMADLVTDLRYNVTTIRAANIGEPGGTVTTVFTREGLRFFSAGERLFVTDIKVEDDNLVFGVLSLEKLYRGTATVEFPKGFLETAGFDRVKTVVDQLLRPEAEATAPKVIALGQTREQVEVVMGRPDRIFDLGARVIYMYKDVKIVFVDGRVADVQ
jgi:hypothetical protein